MSFDTKYRPTRYSDVLGQAATIQICREIIRKGWGFRQSYVFAGPWGGGKTTVGRIFARALLCEQPRDGEACDECTSCLTMLDERSEDFVEVDAATNSSKEDIKRITEEAQYGSFSGNRKIYLLDECHRLSKQSMDALLKPLEDNIRGTQDKQLVAIFCTTEPEAMRSAIISRCAPVFRIRPNSPDEIAARLDFICEQEGLERELEALRLVAEVTECHVRDAIKAVEGVSNLGKIDRASVAQYLSIDANEIILDLLEAIGFDLPQAVRCAERLVERVSPSSSYERMADVSMLAYRLAVLGTGTVPSYWDRDRLTVVGTRHQDYLVQFAERFARRPAHATKAMFACDVASLHQIRANIVVRAAAPESIVYLPSPQPAVPQPVAALRPIAAEPPTGEISTEVPAESEPNSPIEPSLSQTAAEQPSTLEKPNGETGSIRREPLVTDTGVYLHPRAQNTRRSEMRLASIGEASNGFSEAAFFTEILRRRVLELSEEQSGGRSARRHDMGSS